MRRVRTIGWYGGKARLVKHLLQLIPPHKIYLEVFGGGAALLLSKQPAQLEIYNDIDSNLYNLFRVIRDDKLFPIFLHKVKWTLYSREEWRRARKSYRYANNPVEKAVRFFITIRQSFAKYTHSWSYSLKEKSPAKSYFAFIDELEALHRRLRTVQIENLDWKKCIRKYNNESVFLYGDPPYVKEARRLKSDVYSHEFTKEDHEEFVEFLLNEWQGKAMISGYRNPIYERLEKAGWIRKDIEIALFASGKPTTRNPKQRKRERVIESVWMNYKLKTLV
ncbi:DNA adenine methylase [Methanophagales archaeon]|nr:MAG: DNA adenine methylase [Methanophagales archaeon]